MQLHSACCRILARVDKQFVYLLLIVLYCTTMPTLQKSSLLLTYMYMKISVPPCRSTGCAAPVQQQLRGRHGYPFRAFLAYILSSPEYSVASNSIAAAAAHTPHRKSLHEQFFGLGQRRWKHFTLLPFVDGQFCPKPFFLSMQCTQSVLEESLHRSDKRFQVIVSFQTA